MSTVFEASYTELKEMEAERDRAVAGREAWYGVAMKHLAEIERLTDHRDALQGQVKGACDTIERLRAALKLAQEMIESEWGPGGEDDFISVALNERGG